jgi:hypothetical protein
MGARNRRRCEERHAKPGRLFKRIADNPGQFAEAPYALLVWRRTSRMASATMEGRCLGEDVAREHLFALGLLLDRADTGFKTRKFIPRHFGLAHRYKSSGLNPVRLAILVD